jgi:hypothetical protein
MERQTPNPATDQRNLPPLEEQVKQLALRVADLEKRLFELENQPPPQVE